MTTPSAAINADLVRLEHADSLQLSEALKSLLDRGEALDRVVAILERKIDEGAYVLSDQLAALIGHTKSASLYAKTREQLFKDDWALLSLYKKLYPDPDIEKHLATRLYEIASNDGEPRRRYIIDAMRDVGTTVVLPTLEAILFDQATNLKVKQMIVQAFESTGVSSIDAVLATFETGSRKNFLTSVIAARATIKERGSAAAKNASTTTGQTQFEHEEIEQKAELQNAVSARERAWHYLEGDPIVAVFFTRQGAEALGKHLYRFLGHEQGGKPAKKMTLEELLTPVRNSDAPDIFKHSLQTIQLFGNFASHGQDDQSKYLNRNIAESLLKLYDEALKMYRTWLQDKKSVTVITPRDN
jgi:hypothetical protein